MKIVYQTISQLPQQSNNNHNQADIIYSLTTKFISSTHSPYIPINTNPYIHISSSTSITPNHIYILICGLFGGNGITSYGIAKFNCDNFFSFYLFSLSTINKLLLLSTLLSCDIFDGQQAEYSFAGALFFFLGAKQHSISCDNSNIVQKLQTNFQIYHIIYVIYIIINIVNTSNLFITINQVKYSRLLSIYDISVFIIRLPMKLPKLVVLLILFCSLIVQIYNLAIVAYAYDVYSTIDVISPPYQGYPSFKQQNQGNCAYNLVSSTICFIIYLYLFIITIINKTCSPTVDKALTIMGVCFQFGVIVTYFIFLTNNQVRFDAASKAIDNLQAIQEYLPPGDPLPDLLSYRRLFVLRSMSIAGGVLTLFICVIGGALLPFKQKVSEQNAVNKNKQNAVNKNESTINHEQGDVNHIQMSIQEAIDLK